ncbi:MAG: AMP-binding protein [Actinomycetota bacterium]
MADDYLATYAVGMANKLAIIDDRPGEPTRTFTYGELHRYSDQIAHAMVANGVQPKDKVIWCGQNSIKLLAFTHAARKAGVIAVPLNYRLSVEEAAYVVDNSDSVFAWVDAQYAQLLADARPDTPNLRQVVVFDGEALERQISEGDYLRDVPATAPKIAGPPGATMIYTSGTTGKPKGTVRTNGAASGTQQSQALLQLIGYGPGDVYITTGPLYHSGPGAFAAIAAMLGQTVVVQHHFDAEDWVRLVDTYDVTSTFSAPTPIRRICTQPDEVFERYDVSSMRIMIANAAPWPYALKEQYLDRFPEDSLWEVYGSTEMGINTVLAPPDQRRRRGSCGRPAPHVEVALFDPDGERITEPNQPGELFVKASSVFDTYYKAPEKYASEQHGDFHTVGDIAYFDDEGYFYICDRKKDMVISGGMNIYPAEIESALEHHPEVFEAAVFGIPSEEWGESVHAVVVKVPGSAIDDAAVMAYAREHLAGYKVPRSVDFMDELPKTGSGKLLKRELRKPYWQGHESGVL